MRANILSNNSVYSTMQKKLNYALWVLPLLMYWACSRGEKTQSEAGAPYAGPPYTIALEEFVNPNLPALHAYIQAVYEDKIVMMGGRTNGLHQANNYNFKGNYNDTIFVVDTHDWASPDTWTVKKLSVDSDLLSGKENREQLEANNAQFFTKDSVLYIVGGMIGDSVIQTAPGAKHCSPYITAITLPALIQTVNNGTPLRPGSIRQAKDEQLAVTGGELELMDHAFKLVFGWNVYKGGDAYTHEVKSFSYKDNGKTLTISPVTVCPTCRDGHTSEDEGYFRRRDGSMSAMIDPANGEEFLLYYAGVFKGGKIPFDNPVWIGNDDAKEIDFSMRSNIYTCEVIPVYSPGLKQSYATLLGGMTNAIYRGVAPDKLPVLLDKENTVDSLSAPFSNQITTLMIDAQHQFNLYLLPTTFPATQVAYTFKDTTNLAAGSVAYNGTGSELVWTLPDGNSQMPNGVLNYDEFIKAHPQGGLIGYLHGGILSRTENAFGKKSDQLTRASNRIFAVKLVPLNQ